MEGRDFRWYWLESFAEFTLGAVLDFEVVTSVAVSSVESSFIASALDGPWREQVSSRYAAYAGRVGVPTLPRLEFQAYRNEIAKEILEQLSAG